MLGRKSSFIGVAAAVAMIFAGSLAATPASAGSSYHGAKVYQAGYKNWKGGSWNKKSWNKTKKNWKKNNNWNQPNWVAPAIGFGAGIVAGSLLAQPRYYAAPPSGYVNRDSYCHSKYRSYNSRTGTYTGYDGRQHYCRIP